MAPRDRADDAARTLQELGLPADAGPEEIRAARQRLDALLADLEQAPADEGPVATSAQQAEPIADSVADGDTYVDVAALDDEGDGPQTPPEGGPTRVRPAKPRKPARTRGMRAGKSARPRSGNTRRRVALGAMALLVPGLVWGVYAAGAPAQQLPANHPDVAGNAAPKAPAKFDQAKADELTKRIAADPNDIEARRLLATMHFKAEQFAEAATVLNELLERRPQDFDSRLILGVAYFNTGDLPGAEREWNRAAQQDPKSADVHYNLGFLHMSTNPPDMAKVEAEWRLVMELAPDSELAKNVSNHMEKLNGPAPTAAPTKN